MASGKGLKIRILWVMFFVTFFFAVLMGRVFWLQIVRGEELSRKSEDRRVKDEILNPVRGIIYDRNHTELVSNLPVSTVYAHPSVIKAPTAKGEDPEVKKLKAFKEIAAILGLDEAETVAKLSSDKEYLVLKHNVDYDVCQRLKELNIYGLGYAEGTRRTYRQDNMAAHVLGFVGQDNQGLTGIEKSYDQELSGVPGKQVIEVDAQGRMLPQTMSMYVPPVPGNNLVLTIDQTIQYFVERELDRLVQDYSPSKAVILVMEPYTGEVLAMGSRPTFDPGRWKEYPQSVWDKNPALLYNYEPGSTFKILTAAAFLEEGVVSPGEKFNDPGFALVSKRRVACWKREGHGMETFEEAVQNSCNPVFMQLGLRLGKDRLYKYTKGFGMGDPTGIDLPFEEKGLVIPKDKALELDLATMSMGQSVAVTPVQLLRAICAVANGGNLMQPRLVKAVEDASGKVIKSFEPQVVRQVISSQTSQKMKDILQNVILEGTGKNAFVAGYTTAGKTGTAQVALETGGYAPDRFVSSFAGFAPVDQPRLAILVLIADAQGGSTQGGVIAAPAFQSIARDALHYLKVPENPDIKAPGNAGAAAAQARQEAQRAPFKEKVPNVKGIPVEWAVKLLKEKGFSPGSSASAGVVIEQSPSGGSMAVPGSVITLKVEAPGKQAAGGEVTVPDVRGLTLKRAGMLLESMGIYLDPTGSGVAVKQVPAAGVKIIPGSPVKVEFAPPG